VQVVQPQRIIIGAGINDQKITGAGAVPLSGPEKVSEAVVRSGGISIRRDAAAAAPGTEAEADDGTAEIAERGLGQVRGGVLGDVEDEGEGVGVATGDGGVVGVAAEDAASY